MQDWGVFVVYILYALKKMLNEGDENIACD